jgi:hypothetical protein
MNAYRHAVTASSVSLFVVGCTTLPPLSQATGGIPISEIVLRIKCELSDAVTQTGSTPLKYYTEWMDDWTTQIDLTLEILDSSTLAPNASVSQTFTNAYNVAAGPTSISTAGVLGTSLASIPQGFALAGGFSINGQASRTQTLSFNYSFAELKRWRAEPGTSDVCKISDGMDLRGRLGLREWFVEALTPVYDRLLYAGYHPKPGAAAPAKAPNPSGPPAAAATDTSLKNFNVVEDLSCTPSSLETRKRAVRSTLLDAGKKLLDQSLVDLQDRTSNSTSARQTELESALSSIEKASQDIASKIEADTQYKNVLDPYVAGQLRSAHERKDQLSTKAELFSATIRNNLTAANQNAAAAVQTALVAKTQIDDTNNMLNTTSCSTISTLETNANISLDNAKRALTVSGKVATDVAKADDNLRVIQSIVSLIGNDSTSIKAIDPPIATIGQSIQFVLQQGGNVHLPGRSLPSRAPTFRF